MFLRVAEKMSPVVEHPFQGWLPYLKLDWQPSVQLRPVLSISASFAMTEPGAGAGYDVRRERDNIVAVENVSTTTGRSMKRRDFITLVAGAIVEWPFASTAQEAGRIYRFGILEPFSDTPVSLRRIDELRHRGFIEGQNLTIYRRDFGLHVDLISQFAAELCKAQVDVIEAAGSVATRAAQQATKTIPIIGVADDMVGEGLVDSLSRPNGNTTGVSILATELDGKRQELLIEAVPGLRRIAALADSNATAEAKLGALQEAARARNVELSIHRIAKGEEIAGAIDMAQASGATALNVLASPMLFANGQLIMDRVSALRLPAIYQWAEMAEGSGFAAYGPRITQIPEITIRQAAMLFRGARIADIPVEQPTRFELVINLKTANALGVTVPPALLARADKVIE
jgi:putative tryptophan/tyrosine transport system substrate-binding protein